MGNIENSHDSAIRLIWDKQPDKALPILEGLPGLPDVLNDRAVAAFMSGDEEGAMQFLEKVLEADPAHGPGMLNFKYIPLIVPVAPSKHRVVDDWGPPPGSEPAVSIIMPHYNRADFIEEPIRSVLDQTRSDLELVIVNDGGARDCEAIIKRIGTQKIRYLYIEHAGPSAARNAGIANARGRYIAYLDDDDIYYPDHVEALAGYLDEHPEAMVAFSHAMEAEQVLDGGTWRVVNRNVVHRIPFDRERLLRSNLMPTTLVVMHRREVTDEVGGFNEALTGPEDWEMWIRMSARYPFHRIDKVTGEYRVKSGGKTHLTSRVLRMRYYDNVIVYMHRIVPVTTRMPGRPAYRRVMKMFGRFARRHPEFLDIVELRYLKDRPRKLYSLFYAMGKGLIIEGNLKAARTAFMAAAATAPWEPKSYFKWLSLMGRGGRDCRDD